MSPKCALLIALVLLIGTPTFAGSGITVRDTSSTSEACVRRFWPNPFADAGGAWTDFSTPETCLVAIVITDTLDNEVYDFGEQEYPPGQYIVTWMCEDNDGKSVNIGVYHIHLTMRSRPDGRAWESRYRQRFFAAPYRPGDNGESEE